jgi:hypothetical protein
MVNPSRSEKDLKGWKKTSKDYFTTINSELGTLNRSP